LVKKASDKFKDKTVWILKPPPLMHPPSGGGVTRGLYKERMRLHGHLETAMITRLSAELPRRLLWKKEDGGCEWWQTNAENAVKAGLRGAETPTAREEWGGYA
jgi:hypothetical protein